MILSSLLSMNTAYRLTQAKSYMLRFCNYKRLNMVIYCGYEDLPEVTPLALSKDATCCKERRPHPRLIC